MPSKSDRRARQRRSRPSEQPRHFCPRANAARCAERQNGRGPHSGLDHAGARVHATTAESPVCSVRAGTFISELMVPQFTVQGARLKGVANATTKTHKASSSVGAEFFSHGSTISPKVRGLQIAISQKGKSGWSLDTVLMSSPFSSKLLSNVAMHSTRTGPLYAKSECILVGSSPLK